MDVDYTAYLQGSLVLDEEGEWWHEKVKFQNPKLSQFFHKAIRLDPSDGNFYVVVGRQRAQFSYTGTPLFVLSYMGKTQTFVLNNQTHIPLTDASLECRSKDNAMFIRFSEQGHFLTAKLSRGCYQTLSAYVESNNTFRFGSIVKTVHQLSTPSNKTSSISFQPGDIVFLTKFNRDGILMELLPKDKAKVTLGNLSVTVSLDELKEGKNKASVEPQKTYRSYSVYTSAEQSCSWSKDAETIDFHGATVEQALAALEQKISSAIVNRQGRIKVVHGFGSGKVMEAIHQYLAQSSLVTSFRVDDFNPGQTWVYL